MQRKTKVNHIIIMGMFRIRPRHLLLAAMAFFLASSALLHLGHGRQDQQGFISIDCGSNTSLVGSKTGIKYVADQGFVDTGAMRRIPPEYRSSDVPKELWNLRSFPEGVRNCYNIEVESGTEYLIRPTFFYANYDGQNRFPKFDLHLGANLLATINPVPAKIHTYVEVIHITKSNYFQICFVNTGSGIPFVSTIELRPFPDTIYRTQTGSVGVYERRDIGSLNNETYRYPNDVYDRTWHPWNPSNNGWTTISTTSTVRNQDDKTGFQVPSAVLGTASTVTNVSAPLVVSWLNPFNFSQFYVYMFFAELKELQANQSRSFKVYLNGEIFWDANIKPGFLTAYCVKNENPLPRSENYVFTLVMSNGSTLPPILNAIEIHCVMNFPQSETEQDDADAIVSIKSTYGVTKNWQGDPCAPKAHAWQGLNCSYDGFKPPRITGLNLSSSGLVGEITADIWNLKMLEVLDLSNNKLSGPVPDFLAQMPSLRVLNLQGNNLSHQIPAELIKKQNKGSLSLSLDGDPTPTPNMGNVVIPTVAAAVGGVIVLLIGMAIVIIYCKQQITKLQGLETLESRRRHYSYSDILEITNNFEKLLGEGGFGKVYHGVIDHNTEVAVKMLSLTSVQGYQQFQAEVELLLRVHHRNLISLIGYCKEDRHIGLIYEYMEKGDLKSLLLGRGGKVLSWQHRLHIALDTAQGLEYLHNGCRPPIVHRDVKTANILLNKNFQANLADFGLSKVFPTEGGTSHMTTTNVVGTPGYLDPEYHRSFKLTDKSDIYSFGVVLLEIVTGKPALRRRMDTSHITQWVNDMINNGDINSIIDPNLREDYDSNSVWKVVDIAMCCVSENSRTRPTMMHVMNELRESLILEINRSETLDLDHQTHSPTFLSIAYDSSSGPTAR